MSVTTETSWEGRVEALEAEKRAMQAKLEASDATIAELKAAAAASKAAEQARRAREVDSAMVELQRQAVAAQCPIPADDLAKVRAAYDRGDDETANVLSDAFLARSKALGARSNADQGGERLFPAGESAESSEAAAARIAARMQQRAQKGGAK